MSEAFYSVIDAFGQAMSMNAHYLKRLVELEEEKMNAIEGKSYSNRFTIPAGHQTVKVDLSDSLNFKDTHPSGVDFYLPGQPVASAYIFCEGPSDLLYSFNTMNSQQVANSLLKMGEDRQITLPRRLIKVLNFVGQGGGATTVRFEALA
jgi:hypothetical protein